MREYRTPYGFNVVVNEESDVWPADVIEYKEYNLKAPLIKHGTRLDIVARARAFVIEESKERH